MDEATGKTVRLDTKQMVGIVVPCRQNPDHLLLALQRGFAIYSVKTEEVVKYFGNPEQEHWDLRWNDGKCDPKGRFWCGSMHLTGAKKGPQALWMMDSDG